MQQNVLCQTIIKDYFFINLVLQRQMNSTNFITNKLLSTKTMTALHLTRQGVKKIQYFLLDTSDFIDHRKLKG